MQVFTNSLSDGTTTTSPALSLQSRLRISAAIKRNGEREHEDACTVSSQGHPSILSPFTEDSCTGQKFSFLKAVVLGVAGEARHPPRHRGELEWSVLLDWTVCDL